MGDVGHAEHLRKSARKLYWQAKQLEATANFSADDVRAVVNALRVLLVAIPPVGVMSPKLDCRGLSTRETKKWVRWAYLIRNVQRRVASGLVAGQMIALQRDAFICETFDALERLNIELERLSKQKEG